MSDEIRRENPSGKIIRENPIEKNVRGNPIGESNNPPLAAAPDSDSTLFPHTTTFEGENVKLPPAEVPHQESSETQDGQKTELDADLTEKKIIQLIQGLFDKLNKNYPNWKIELKNYLLEWLGEPNENNLIITKPDRPIEPDRNLAENLPPENSPFWQEKLAEAQKGQPTTSENQPPTDEPTTPEGAATDAKKSVEQPDRLAEIKNDLKQILEDLSNQKKPEESNSSPNQSTLP